MSNSINKAILIGRVGKNPEIRQLPNGAKLASFSIATSEKWRDKNTNERKEKTEWHQIFVSVPSIVDIIEKFVVSGVQLYIDGSIYTKKYQNKSGIDCYSTQIKVENFKHSLTILDSKNQKENDKNAFNGF